MRTFEHFPKDATCPICCKNTDQGCTLLPIDNTSDGSICEAQPVHTECLQTLSLRINKSVGIIYGFYSDKS